MKYMHSWLAVLVVVGAGCSTLHEVRYADSEQWLPEARQKLLDREVTVITRDGRSFTGTIFILDTGEVALRSEERNVTWSQPLENVESIQTPTRTLPVVGGSIAGALAGLLIGGSVGATEEPELNTLGLNTVASAATGAWVGTPIGAIGGGVIVGLATSADRYRIIPQSPPRKVAPVAK